MNPGGSQAVPLPLQPAKLPRFLYSHTFGRAEPMAKCTINVPTINNNINYQQEGRAISLAKLVILKEDREWAERRIAELEKDIQALGPEFYEALNQSSESWHDNAPFDAARDKQAVLFAEYTNLKQTLLNSTIEIPKHSNDTVGIGSIIKVTDARRTRKIKIAGDWTHQAGRHDGDVVIVSAQSPIAKGFLGQKVGTKTEFGVVNEINNTKTQER